MAWSIYIVDGFKIRHRIVITEACGDGDGGCETETFQNPPPDRYY